MSEINSHRDLEAWQIAMDAVVKTYDVTSEFPKSELYGLTGQMRRAAVSVPSNIAEGQARFGRAGLNHIAIALGSLAELDTQLEVAIRLAYLTLERAAPLQKTMESSRRLLYGLRRETSASRDLSRDPGMRDLLHTSFSRIARWPRSPTPDPPPPIPHPRSPGPVRERNFSARACV